MRMSARGEENHMRTRESRKICRHPFWTTLLLYFYNLHTLATSDVLQWIPVAWSLKSACWSTRHLMQQHLDTCAITVWRCIHLLLGCDFWTINVIFMQDGRELGFVSPEAGTDFLLFCVRPIQATVSKLDSSPICSVVHTLLLVGCKTPLLRQGYVTIPVKNYHYY